MKKKIAFTILFTASLILPWTVYAQSYDIGNEAVDQMGEEKESDNYKMNDALGQTTSGTIEGASFKIESGVMYYDLIPLSFTLSNSSVDFGLLTPNTPSTGSTDITVITNSPEGYQVTAYETTPLKLKNYSGNTNKIPYGSGDGDDLPFNSITESVEGAWDTYSSQFGFGYTLSNLAGTDATFTSGYREFADYSFSETPQSVMSRAASTPESGNTVRVTYQTNVGQIQPAGSYENTVIYILTATF